MALAPDEAVIDVHVLAPQLISTTETAQQDTVLNWQGINFIVQPHEVTRPPKQKRGTNCAAHVHTEDVPLEDHHVFPQEYGGKTVSENMARICSNAHGMVHYFIDLLLYHHGEVPWEIATHFGYRVRALAMHGYEQIAALPKDVLAGIIIEAQERLEAA